MLRSDWPRAFLVITWEPDFPTCSFCRMSKGQKYFDSTSFPDKTNEQIFLKTPKTLFWAILAISGHFCWKGIFPKKMGFCQEHIHMAPNTNKVSEKTNEHIPRKLSKRRTKGLPIIHTTLPATAEGSSIKTPEWP